MAPPTLFLIFLAIAISSQTSIATPVDCENLTEESCAYAVSSKGKRCLLEKSIVGREYTCTTSEITADKLSDYIETEECINACGVKRKVLGISSDNLLERGFAGRLCSEECYLNCPNIVDLYFNLAAGEGVYLPNFCEKRQTNRRRELEEIASSGIDVDGDEFYAPGPSQAPTPSF